MGRKRRKKPVAPENPPCNNSNGMFGNIICLIIVLIVLEFLCSVLGEEECC